jgi:transposase InsO family protein
MPKQYPPEFRHRLLELVRAGRSVVEVAGDLGVSSQTIYNWRRQDEIDLGLRPGVSSSDHAEFVAARRRIAQLESELAVARRCGRTAASVEDLVDRDFTVIEPDALWVTDITEHPTREGALMQRRSRRLLTAAWWAGRSTTARPTALVTNALAMALQNRSPQPGTILHSDHGTQFTSWAFKTRVKQSGLLAAYDNAVIEAFWARMQVELLNRKKWRTPHRARKRQSSNTSRSSTTANAATPHSTCTPQSNTKCSTTPVNPQHENPKHPPHNWGKTTSRLGGQAVERKAEEGCRLLEQMADQRFLSTAAAETCRGALLARPARRAETWVNRAADPSHRSRRRPNCSHVPGSMPKPSGSRARRWRSAVTLTFNGRGDANTDLAEVLLLGGRTAEAAAALDPARRIEGRA